MKRYQVVSLPGNTVFRNVRNFPTTSSPVVGEIREGTILRDMTDLGLWIGVTLEDGTQGYVYDAPGLEIIELDVAPPEEVPDMVLDSDEMYVKIDKVEAKNIVDSVNDIADASNRILEILLNLIREGNIDDSNDRPG